MNRKLRVGLIVFILVATGVLAFLRFSEGAAPPPVDLELVNIAAESSRAARTLTPPNEDLPREGRATPGAINAPGLGR